MKKFVEITVQFKFVWGLFFSAALLLYTTISMILGNSSMELIVVWQLVAITLVLTFFHYLFFGELILTSLSMKLRMIIHWTLCYLTILLSFCLFNWIKLSKLNDLSIFTGAYIVLYLSCIFSFYIYYKVTGEELNDRLTAYKEKRNVN
jgi:hypothetical protein